MSYVEYSKLNENEVRDFLQKKPIALLPVGAVEDHGPHLPLGTDTFLAEAVARRVCARLENASVLPPVYYGQVWSLEDFPGSVNVGNEALQSYIVAVGKSLFQQGFGCLAMINSHVGNMVALKAAARTLFESTGGRVLYLTYPDAESVISRVCESPRPHPPYFHACEIETSYMLYLAPELVRMEEAVRNIPEFPPDFDYTPTPWRKIMQTAVMGDATLATEKKGREIIDHVVDTIVALLKTGG